MAKKTKAPEQDSNPAVLSDAEIVVDTQQPEQQSDTPPLDTEALPTDLAAEEVAPQEQDGTEIFSEMNELQSAPIVGENIIPESVDEAQTVEPISFEAAKAAKEAEAAAAEMLAPEEQLEDTRWRWRSLLF